MNIHLTESQKALIAEGIETGRFKSPDDAIKEALRLWEQREARFIQAVLEGEAAADRGEFLSHEEVREHIERLFAS